jgi:proline dehydrogenase
MKKFTVDLIFKELTMLDNELISIGSEALRKVALNQQAKTYILENKILYDLFKKAANRYIGGETLDETLVKVIDECNNNFKCSIEFMGENTKTAVEAIEAKDEFLKICHEIAKRQLNCTVSLDLSHLGLGMDKDLCRQNLDEVCSVAKSNQTEVIISAEGIDATDHVINLYLEAAKRHENLSITLQAYLHRSKDDFKELLKAKGRIRVVKGAFDVPSKFALFRGDALDEVYLNYVDQLLSLKHRCSIATHHDRIQQSAKQLIKQHAANKGLYEFESLYGICNDQLAKLKEEGFPAKIYFVYGKEWYLYLCNRIAEYPMNIFLALNDIVK